MQKNTLLVLALAALGAAPESYAAQPAAYVSESGYLRLAKLDFDAASLGRRCPAHELTVPHSERRWEVSGLRKIAAAGGIDYYFQSCEGKDLPKDALRASLPRSNVAAFLFERKDGGPLHVIWAETVENFGVDWFEKAEVVPVPHGQVLIVRHPAGGNAGFNQDRYLLVGDDGWHLLETESWKKDLRARLPEGHFFWNDLYPDLARMKAVSDVWRDKLDSHASPSGGRIEAELAIEGDRLVVRDMSYLEKPEP